MTRKPDPYLVERLWHHLSPHKYGPYLDIGCGTGNYTIELHRKGLAFIGIDPSLAMLTQAQAKVASIDWKQGKAEQIPLASKSVYGVIASLTVHHWDDLNVGFQELNRVIKPNKKIVVFTSTADQMKGYWLNHYFPKMLEDSMQQMPEYVQVEQSLSFAGFEVTKTEIYEVKSDLKDLFLYSGKHNPSLYLNPQIRNGISSFSDLAHAKEVETGLEKLKRDIESGKIKEVVDRYQHEEGDYLYIVGKSR